MIKFKHLIHKPTGIEIKYDSWLIALNENNNISWRTEPNGKYWSYNPKEMLFSDDFEVVYDC